MMCNTCRYVLVVEKMNFTFCCIVFSNRTLKPLTSLYSISVTEMCFHEFKKKTSEFSEFWSPAFDFYFKGHYV